MNPNSLGKFGGLWLILHGYGDFWIEPGKLSFFVLFPLIPWMGVMALGYATGTLLSRNDWRKIVFSIGAAATATFVFLRYFHLYGNSHHMLNGVAAGRWRIQPTFIMTIVSFLDTLKYPPSLQFLLMTLGPSLMALAWLGGVDFQKGPQKWLGQFLAVYGRVPLFFYLVHIYLIHTLAVYCALLCKQKAAWLLYGGFLENLAPPGYGHGLSFIYAMWLGAVLFMYPLCRGFMAIKEQNRDWVWLRYF